MARLTAQQRKDLPPKDFAGPNRSYPIQDKAHARNALARVSEFGSPAEKAKVRAAVAKKYPGMGGPKGAGAGKAGPRPALKNASGSADRTGGGRPRARGASASASRAATPMARGASADRAKARSARPGAGPRTGSQGIKGGRK